ncbi:MAG: DUF4418 family protein [Planctomycetes bacterium]|nr:DUF4418 family protein [Planctomycetota bacterium]MCD7896867.1 DUF4418 family protein [Planctomycetaceae bacterium]
MKRSLCLTLPLVALGLLLTAIPGWLFPVCPIKDHAAPMRCYHSGVWLTGIGVGVVGLGVLLFLLKGAAARTVLAIAVVAAGIAAALVPTVLIGMCRSPMMPCRTGTYPAAMIVAALIALCGVIDIFFLRSVFLRERRGDEASYNLAYSPE